MKNFFHFSIAAPVLAAVLAIGTAPPLVAQSGTPRPDAARLRQMHAVLASIDPDRPVSTDDAARMLGLLDKAEATGLAIADRRAAMTELYRELWRLRGFDLEADAAQIRAAANAAAGLVAFGGSFSLEAHVPGPGAAEGRIHVVKRGSGPVPVLLVSTLALPAAELYGSFMERNASRYTMYAVTLPGFGEAPPLPRPAKLDYAATHWLDAAERQMADFLVRGNLKDVVVIGTAAGGYFSAALAARHPERIRAAVVVNGLVNAPMRALGDPLRPAAFEERLERARRAAPVELRAAFWPPSRDEFRALVTNPPQGTAWGNPLLFGTRDTELALRWTLDYFTPESVWRQVHYGAELGATDLTADLRKLQRPLLVIASIHDHLSPGVGSAAAGQWTELKLRAPGTPVTIVPFADVRTFASHEAPELFDRALGDFLSGRPVTGTTKRAPVALPSPFGSTSAYIGASEVSVEYFRPAVKGREIWGKLVPYDTIWRTGANEAPMITFTHDVTIEGRPLAAGTYTLFTIPGRTEWTLILNRIPWQFGLFIYDPEFDALRVTVPVQTGEMREAFEIAVEPTGPAEGVVTLRWERIAVPFKVALAGQ